MGKRPLKTFVIFLVFGFIVGLAIQNNIIIIPAEIAPVIVGGVFGIFGIIFNHYIEIQLDRDKKTNKLIDTLYRIPLGGHIIKTDVERKYNIYQERMKPLLEDLNKSMSEVSDSYINKNMNHLIEIYQILDNLIHRGLNEKEFLGLFNALESKIYAFLKAYNEK
jgi:hypothetical protein